MRTRDGLHAAVKHTHWAITLRRREQLTACVPVQCFIHRAALFVTTAMMPALPGHHRNVSQGQHLIVEPNESGDEDDGERGRTAVFPGGSPTHSTSTAQCRPQNNKPKGLCHDPHIRSNVRVILGSIVLTIVGTVLLIVGTIVMFRPDEGPQGWVFLFAGFLCFVPGSYHVYYIICTVCGRPGYSLISYQHSIDNLCGGIYTSVKVTRFKLSMCHSIYLSQCC
ncbi:hypothetical protein KIN20_035712 [Parelaphostrongylus tenuis]|uniref:Transmembrane protein 134 n=1 Tax=Parelaphostrongylus tenuis TaxID=148309 RepID=A0AAD5RC40_PARTN|nr:hypothetical protein KIN20_035712 [Parelaphostrongylus tenuis]